ARMRGGRGRLVVPGARGARQLRRRARRRSLAGGRERGRDMTLDRIVLRGLRVFARHGVLEAERRDGQEFAIDAVLWLDTSAAAASDDLAKTIDYGALANRLVRLARGPPGPLIRTL